MISTVEICQAVAETIKKAAIFKQVQSARDLTESIPETPLAQVYFESKRQTSPGTSDRMTFGGQNRTPPVRQHTYTVHIDLYCRQRSSVSDDMLAVEEIVDVVDMVLGEEVGRPFFGLPALTSFQWNIERVTFDYGTFKYAGARVILTLTAL